MTLTYEDRTAYQLTLLDDYCRAYVFCDLFREVSVNTTIRALIAAMRAYRAILKPSSSTTARISKGCCSSCSVKGSASG